MMGEAIIKTLADFKGSKGTDSELIRDHLLCKGQTAALVYGKETDNAELYTMQAASALSIGKPFGGLIPARPIKTAIVGYSESDETRKNLNGNLEGFWLSSGWTQDEIDRSFQGMTLIDIQRGRTGASFCADLEDALRKSGETFDLIILRDAIAAYGDDTEIPQSATFAHFLKSHANGLQSVAPCAILALVKMDDKKGRIERILADISSTGREYDDSLFRDDLFSSLRGRAVYEWADRIFIFGRPFYTPHPIRALYAFRAGSSLQNVWHTIGGKEARGYAIWGTSTHFTEITLANLDKLQERYTTRIGDAFHGWLCCVDTTVKS